RNQVIAFVLAVVVCLLFLLSGFPLVLDFFNAWAPQMIVDLISSFSFLTHFNAISKGVIDLRDIIFFVSLIVFFLFVNALLVDLKKAD
ncbi:MAG: ABC transporter permease, partial [Arenicellales bacterium WSBS_2016_MAG_OTU3]